MELNEKMLKEIFNALEKGETFNYSDDNTTFSISPNGISIQYQNNITTTKKVEVEKFLEYCDRIDDELFVEVCESFEDGELTKLQEQLDTDNYRETIKVFTKRIKEIANNKLTEIVNAADSEIKRQELNIKNAQAIIDDIHAELDRVQSKYLV